MFTEHQHQAPEQPLDQLSASSVEQAQRDGIVAAFEHLSGQYAHLLQSDDVRRGVFRLLEKPSRNGWMANLRRVSEFLAIASAIEHGRQAPDRRSRVAAVDDIPRDAAPSPRSIGEVFLYWLQRGLQEGRLNTNTRGALVHGVEGTWLLVSPGIFRRFCLEHDDLVSDWRDVQQRFQKLGLHRVHEDGTNIHEASLVGVPGRPDRKVKGYLLKEPAALHLPQRNNTVLSLTAGGVS